MNKAAFCIYVSRALNLVVQCGQWCACFPDFLQNFRERQILSSLCSVVFHALPLRLPIQTSLSVAPKLQVCLRFR